jgi:hypothetical protein
LEDNSTKSDSSRTEAAQNHYTERDFDESPAKAKLKDATDQIHFSHTSDTSFCAPGVPEENDAMDSLPADLPPTVIDGIRNWHELPEHVQRAIKAQLRATEE